MVGLLINLAAVLILGGACCCPAVILARRSSSQSLSLHKPQTRVAVVIYLIASGRGRQARAAVWLVAC